MSEQISRLVSSVEEEYRHGAEDEVMADPNMEWKDMAGGQEFEIRDESDDGDGDAARQHLRKAVARVFAINKPLYIAATACTLHKSSPLHPLR
ncbi:uncharacterized protein EV420DRAFT_1642493 [Desarmillaria tabescens]|uniref:Uncharacterized protein n=1 Tax=Armillaria tabescens TaxID=1929756 RepID=A0AA39KH66_ARMTA|nr:uncharacterized protein EV420DRAFT_1642493 [Desarmillaria tabescens]KAK0458773.1 hypothetical protein EV420DRAFT_1642493 [Desarmillaria tabescens]